MYAPTPEEIVRRFAGWETAAARSMNPAVARTAPLDPPTLDQARELLPRLVAIRSLISERGTDFHGRPVANREQSAMGALWEEWRDNILGRWNGYRDVWTRPDEFYDGPAT